MDIGIGERFLERKRVGRAEHEDVRCFAVADAFIVDAKHDVFLRFLSGGYARVEAITCSLDVHCNDCRLVDAVEDVVGQLRRVDVAAVLSRRRRIPGEECLAVLLAQHDVLRNARQVVADEDGLRGFHTRSGGIGRKDGIFVVARIASVVDKRDACAGGLVRICLDNRVAAANCHLADAFEGVALDGLRRHGKFNGYRLFAVATGCQGEVVDGCRCVDRRCHFDGYVIEIEFIHLCVADRLEAEVVVGFGIDGECLFEERALQRLYDGFAEDFVAHVGNGASRAERHAHLLGPARRHRVGVEADAVEVVGCQMYRRRDEPVVHTLGVAVGTYRRTGVFKFPRQAVAVGIDDSEKVEVGRAVERFFVGHGECLADEQFVGRRRAAFEVVGQRDYFVPECRERQQVGRVDVFCRRQFVGYDYCVGIANHLIVERRRVDVSAVGAFGRGIPVEAYR